MGKLSPKLVVVIAMRSSSVKSFLGLYIWLAVSWCTGLEESVHHPLPALQPRPQLIKETSAAAMLLPILRSTFCPFRGGSSITFHVKSVLLPV